MRICQQGADKLPGVAASLTWETAMTDSERARVVYCLQIGGWLAVIAVLCILLSNV
jgi:hypothetical protein